MLGRVYIGTDVCAEACTFWGEDTDATDGVGAAVNATHVDASASAVMGTEGEVLANDDKGTADLLGAPAVIVEGKDSEDVRAAGAENESRGETDNEREADRAGGG